MLCRVSCVVCPCSNVDIHSAHISVLEGHLRESKNRFARTLQQYLEAASRALSGGKKSKPKPKSQPGVPIQHPAPFTTSFATGGGTDETHTTAKSAEEEKKAAAAIEPVDYIQKLVVDAAQLVVCWMMG